MTPKILENLRTASRDQKFTGFHLKNCNVLISKICCLWAIAPLYDANNNQTKNYYSPKSLDSFCFVFFSYNWRNLVNKAEATKCLCSSYLQL